MKKSAPAESPDAYVAALGGWHRPLVEGLRRSTLAAGKLDERIKWGHLVYFSNGFWRGKRLRELEARLKPGGKYELATMVLVEGDKIGAGQIKRLVKAAIDLNHSIGDPTAASNSAA